MNESIAALTDLLAAGDVTVLSGAGMSTDSGIPDYRGPDGALQRHTPMTYREFLSGPQARRRYWARSHAGWRRVAQARPNAAHSAVAALEHGGHVSGVITQNVDGLHQRAGSRDVIELHGSLAAVVCLSCGQRRSRREMAARLKDANPDFGLSFPVASAGDAAAPDGDADLPDALVDGFTVVGCRGCGDGILKPEVVFFGESVPRERVERCFEMVERSRALLVVGSSLTVMSGYRFVIRARDRGIPVAIVNRGPSRGEDDACVRIDAGVCDVLPRVVQHSTHDAPSASMAATRSRVATKASGLTEIESMPARTRNAASSG